MSFKYINPSFNEGAAFASFKEVTETDSRFVTGKALEYVSPTYFDFPEAGKHIYCSFAAKYVNSLKILFLSKNGSNTIQTGLSDNGIQVNDSSIYTLPSIDSGYHNLFFEIYSDATSGFFEFYVDGLKYYRFEGDVNHGNDLTRMFISKSGWDTIKMGNFIISNEPISKTEKICVLSPTSTTATMTNNGDGSYTATAENQTVLQKFDIEDLTTKVNGGTVTGLVVVGNPAYCGDGDLLHLAGVKGTSEQATIEIPTVEGKSVLASWSENLNPAALADVQIGWKAKA